MRRSCTCVTSSATAKYSSVRQIYDDGTIEEVEFNNSTEPDKSETPLGIKAIQKGGKSVSFADNQSKRLQEMDDLVHKMKSQLDCNDKKLAYIVDLLKQQMRRDRHSSGESGNSRSPSPHGNRRDRSDFRRKHDNRFGKSHSNSKNNDSSKKEGSHPETKPKNE